MPWQLLLALLVNYLLTLRSSSVSSSRGFATRVRSHCLLRRRWRRPLQRRRCRDRRSRFSRRTLRPRARRRGPSGRFAGPYCATGRDVDWEPTAIGCPGRSAGRSDIGSATSGDADHSCGGRRRGALKLQLQDCVAAPPCHQLRPYGASFTMRLLG